MDAEQFKKALEAASNRNTGLPGPIPDPDPESDFEKQRRLLAEARRHYNAEFGGRVLRGRRNRIARKRRNKAML